MCSKLHSDSRESFKTLPWFGGAIRTWAKMCHSSFMFNNSPMKLSPNLGESFKLLPMLSDSVARVSMVGSVWHDAQCVFWCTMRITCVFRVSPKFHHPFPLWPTGHPSDPSVKPDMTMHCRKGGAEKAVVFLRHMFFVCVVWQTVRIISASQIGKTRTKLVASPWVWQLQAKLKCLTCPISNGVEENLICCGEFFIFGKGVSFFLDFHMSLVGMNTWLLIVVHSIPSNICVLAAFLPSRMNLDQHRHLSFGCGALGCWDVDNSVFSRAHLGIWPTSLMEAANDPHLCEFEPFLSFHEPIQTEDKGS